MPWIQPAFSKKVFASQEPKALRNKWFVLSVFDTTLWLATMLSLIVAVAAHLGLSFLSKKLLGSEDQVDVFPPVWYSISTLLGENVSLGCKVPGKK